MARDVLNIACGQLGVTESPAGSNRTKYGKWMGLDGQPWCMSFVQWCFHQAGTPLPHKTGSCSALLNWYKANRPACVVKDPQPRDIIIYNFGHTGILESAGTATVTAIEGNTSPGHSGSQENGGGVFRRTRSKTLVRAYIRPFTEKKEEKAVAAEKRYNTLAECPAWAQDTVRKLIRHGSLGDGTGKTDGQGLPADLNLSADMLRVLVTMDREGACGK